MTDFAIHAPRPGMTGFGMPAPLLVIPAKAGIQSIKLSPKATLI